MVVIITLTSYKRHCVSNNHQYNWSFNSLYWLTTKKHHRSTFLPLCKNNPPRPLWWKPQRTSNAESVSMGRSPHDPLLWRHNGHSSVSNHQPYDCLHNRLFRPWSKKTSKLRVTGLCVGNSPGPVNSPHKGPVTRKMFPFDDVIMQ